MKFLANILAPAVVVAAALYLLFLIITDAPVQRFEEVLLGAHAMVLIGVVLIGVVGMKILDFLKSCKR